MKMSRFLLFLLVNLSISQLLSQIHLSEGFESGLKPVGWTEEAVSGNEPWRYRNGGHSPNDNNWQVPADQDDITRNPPSAYDGIYNAIFFKQGVSNERTKLISPEMDLLGATALELSFYLCQIPWTFEGSTGWDVLRVYYKVSASDPWILLHEYLDPVYEWEEQKLNLPNPSETYYLAFEGHTRWGYGTCIDNITIQETESQQLYIGDIEVVQPFSNFVPSGAKEIPILRVNLKVFGNSGSASLDNIRFTSLNTDDGDLDANGLKLYGTTTQNFDKSNPLGSAGNFSSGIASFLNLNHELPPGISYIWLTYDVSLNAAHGNSLDVMVAAHDISANGQTYPATDQSPDGYKTVCETRFLENFDGVNNWTLTGEFEVASPNGMGGIPGNPNPAEAFSGAYALGTDLTGTGAYPFHYESGLNEASSYRATTPTIDVGYYKNLNLFFMRYLNIEVWDQAAIEISNDNGSSWNTLWENSSYLSDFQWSEIQLPIPEEYSRSEQVKIRFKLGPTDGFNNYSGWNIDDLFLTGEFISKDVGVSEWITPQSGSGHTSSDSVTVRIKNYGGADIVDPVPVAYSFDGGASWTINQMNVAIPVGGTVDFTFSTRADLSVPGLLPSVLARTAMPGDQFTGNDQIATEIYLVPTYAPPYLEEFETGEGFWRSMGNKIWTHGTPSGSSIDHANSGSMSWITGTSSTYGDLISERSQIIFEDGFESDNSWTFSGEFEREIPSNTALPWFANSGYYCIGTDLSGNGSHPYEYENGIGTGSEYMATSPALDVSAYSNLRISFASWISIQNGDSIRLEVSPDNGSTWHTLWKNSQGEIMEMGFENREYTLPDIFSNTVALRLRFSIFHSSAGGSVSAGWNIDDLLLTGDLVHLEPAYFCSPRFDLSGIQNPVLTAKIWVDTEQDVDGVTLYYSLDDGLNWSAVDNSSGLDEYWNWYNEDSVSALELDGWSGQSGDWFTITHLLPPLLANNDNVQLRFTFMADKLNNQYDGIALDDIQILEAPPDIDLLDIIDPVSACDLSSEQTFTLSLRNSGLATLHTGDSIQIAYHIDRNGDIQLAEETLVLTADWTVGSTMSHEMNSAFDFSHSGDYLVRVSNITPDPHFYGPVSNDTLVRTITVRKPYVELGEDISTAMPDTVLLRAYSGVPGQTYVWQDLSTDSVFQVASEGTYHVNVDNGLCTASDTIHILRLVLDLGVTTYLGPPSDCELENSLPLEVSIENLGTDTLMIGDSVFVGGEINSSIFFEDTLVLTQRFFPNETMDHIYSETFDFSPPGAYELKLYTRTQDDTDATNDTLFHTLQVFGYPDAYLGPDTVVYASSYLLTPGPGYADYLWQDGSAAETFLVDQTGLGMYYVSISDVNQCTGQDTVLVTLNTSDLELEQLLSPATSCELSSSITVAARIRNSGNQIIPSGESLNMNYQINGGTVVTEPLVLSSNFLPGHTLDFTFSNAESVVTGSWYDFTVYVDYSPDVERGNDTIITSVGVFESPDLDLGDPYQVIMGFEHTLDAGPGFLSYEWQDGSSEQTYTISEPGIGHYSVTVTDVNGCSAYDEVGIMLATPDIGVQEISHPVNTCHLGEEEHMVVAIQNFGNWDIDPSASITVSYSVNGSAEVTEDVVLDGVFTNGTIIYHTFSGAVDFSEPGLYDIMVFTTYAPDLIESNNLAFVNVNHYGAPVVDIGNGSDTLFVAEPITLQATPGYPSYLWQDGGSGTEYVIDLPSAGWYKVIVTGDNGCETHDSVFVVYDQPDLAISAHISPLSSCSQSGPSTVSMEIINLGYYRISTLDTLSISYSVDGGASEVEQIFLESNLPPGQSRVLSFTNGYDFSSPGIYSIQTSLIFGPDLDRSNNTIITNVESWELPTVDIGNGKDTLLTDLPVILHAGSGFSSYLWQDYSTEESFSASEVGWYWVSVSNSHGCVTTDSVYVTTQTSAREVEDFGKVKIYPNPVREQLHVELELFVEREVIIELYSMSNVLVYKGKLQNAIAIESHINVQGFAPGVYVLRVQADQTPYNFLVVVE
ncbi:MAG: T9SS type A sorting domain-containing protein [Bacteroidales bacterium]|nr:T9SS type A sorting domain-containing protein [Bacteroidales bacterium]